MQKKVFYRVHFSGMIVDELCIAKLSDANTVVHTFGIHVCLFFGRYNYHRSGSAGTGIYV